MRLPYIPSQPTFENASDQAFLKRLLKARGANGLSYLDRALLYSPPQARGFLQFFTAVRGKSTLPADAMELGMCRVAALNGAAYEWMHHGPLLKAAGLSDEAVETVRSAPAGTQGSEGQGGLSLRLWKMLRYTDAMTKQVHVPDEIFEGVKSVLNDRQVTELTLVIAGYNAVSRFLVAMDVAELKDVEVGQAKHIDADAGKVVEKSKL
ncbi:4-carboxymuconolactone decarboxylase family protein [Rhizodiscina lignyota]|uniref:4-carboxymuconolactone decarboxylase family protein n=1 Tax=Rhizodiscina lignyota TaxID=1504668 RepID=A0A9P4IDG7_9PEZI|nr:4-carboxymuconolactone decarboxylase family protein [Rhizodiscina lignyota]